MPLITNEEAERRIRADPASGGGVYCVSAVIVSDWNGPVRWCQWLEPQELVLDQTGAPNPVRAVEDEARLFMWQQVSNGRRGVLFVANVLQVVDGMLRQVDTYAVYADDPERPEGMQDAERPWTPPAGFDGTDGRMPFPVIGALPQVLN